MTYMNVWCNDKKVSAAGGDLHDAPPCNTGGFEKHQDLTGDKKLNNYGNDETSNLTHAKAVIGISITMISLIVTAMSIIYLINYGSTFH